jgi:cell division septation protein DedD
LVLLLGLTVCSAELLADEPDYILYNWPVVEDDFVIVDVRLNGRSVISDLSGYYTANRKLLLSITPLNAALGINFSIDDTTLKGNIPKSDVSFSSLLQSTPSLTANDFLWAEDDFDHYVDLEVLNSVLNLQVAFDYGRMQVSFMTKLLESPKDTKKIFKSKQKQGPVFERDIEDKFQHITYPVADYAASSIYSSNQTKLKNKATLNTYFDLFKHKAEYRFNHTDSGTNQFIKLSKSLENPDQEGVLSEVHYELGDIQSQRDPLIMNFTQGRGVSLSNINSNTSQSFASITIEEPTLPGWFAELYRNGQFVSAVESTDENIVRFENVETFYGNNVFEIRLYGPEGEQVTKTKKISVGNEALAPGQLGYQFEVLDSTRNVLNTQFNNATNFRQSVIGNVSYGLSETLTYGIGLNYLTGIQDNRYLSTSLQSNSEFGSFKFAGAKQVDRGTALFAGYRGEAALFDDQNISMNLEYSQINNFNSAVFIPQNASLKSRASISLSSRFTSLDNMSWNFRFLNEQREQKQTQQISQLGLSSRYLGGNWSTRFLYNNVQQTITNQSYWTVDLDAWRWTNSVDWKPFESDRQLRYRTSLRWPKSKNSFNQTRLSYDENASAKLVLKHQYTYQGKYLNFNVSGQYDNENEWQMTVGFSGTVSFDPFNKHINFLPPRSLNSGQLAVESFVDTNNNGLFDSNDEPITDVGFMGNYLWKERRTNEQGQLMLPSSGGGQMLSVDFRTLSNPYYQPVHKTIRAISHRGGVTKVNYPIEIISEVEGSLYYAINNKSQPASNVTVVLIDKDGNEQYETTSEYDGYYYFPKVTVGEYSLQFRQNKIEVNKLVTLNVPDKIIAPDYGDAVIINDIILQEKQNILTTPTAIAQNYFVQLGVFKYFDSAEVVAQKHMAFNFPLQLYQNVNHGKYYLVAGPYATREKAQSIINKAYTAPELVGSSLIDARKYQSDNWQRLDDTLTPDTKPVNSTSAQHYYCQYAAYKNRNFINTEVLKAHKRVFLAEVAHQKDRYTVILSGPFASVNSAKCDTGLSKQLKENSPPIIKYYKQLVITDSTN